MYKKGDYIKCTVTGIKEYGIFVSTDDGYTGLIHISEISNTYVKNINKITEVGNIINGLILDINREEKQLYLSIKNINYLHDTEQEKIKQTKYGFYYLHMKLPLWIKEKLKDIKSE